jgi:excisionase family DNA binding protein
MSTNAQPIEKVLYRPSEAAVIAGTSKAWIYARIQDGSLPAKRLAGRMVRIHKDDLMKFIGPSGSSPRPPVSQQPTKRARSTTRQRRRRAAA